MNTATHTDATVEPIKLARRSNPNTSHQAARRVSEFARKHHAQILGVLSQHPAGLTVHEIAGMCRLDAHAVGKRMGELEKAGAAYVAQDVMTGEDMTRISPTGRQARVWCLTCTGLAVVSRQGASASA